MFAGTLAVRSLLGLALVLAPAFALAQAQAPAPVTAADPMEATSDPRSAIVSPLRIVTVATADMTATRRFYQGALGMVPAASNVSGPAAQAIVRHYGLPPAATVHTVIFSRPGVPDAAIVRAFLVPRAGAVSRPDFNAEYVGALGMGIPVRDLARHDAIVTAFGFRSQVGVTSMVFPRADKTTYTVGETHYLAPDNILVLGVDRGTMRPVGPIDPAIDIGGPAYVSAIISDAGKLAPFFAQVLGYEMRREMTFQSKGAAGGMRLPPGTDVRFQQWFAPGAGTGYLVIMDLLNAGKDPPAPLGLGAPGVGMWSFETADLALVRRRAASVGAKLLSPPASVDVPGIGRATSMVLATPDGLPVEIYQRRR